MWTHVLHILPCVFERFFSETGAGKHVPRCVMVDLEPTEACKCSVVFYFCALSTRNFCDPTCGDLAYATALSPLASTFEICLAWHVNVATGSDAVAH